MRHLTIVSGSDPTRWVAVTWDGAGWMMAETSTYTLVNSPAVVLAWVASGAW